MNFCLGVLDQICNKFENLFQAFKFHFSRLLKLNLRVNPPYSRLRVCACVLFLLSGGIGGVA